MVNDPWIQEVTRPGSPYMPTPKDARDLLAELVAVHMERDWLAQALADQEAAYAALEQQYLAVSDAHAALVDKVAALAAEAIG